MYDKSTKKMHYQRSLSKKAIMISLLLILSLSILLNSSPFLPNVNAKEIEATNEWQVVQEGDTIPAGLHVRMDFNTGTKWVKLIDDDETDGSSSTALKAVDNKEENEEKSKQAEGNNNSNTKITHLTNTQVDPQKSAKITSQLLEQAQQEQKRKANLKQSIASLNDFNGDMTLDELDYEMMHRTLMSLPDEVRHKLDVPAHPFKNDNDNNNAVDMDDEENVQKLNVFIEKIKDIWKSRQEALKQLEEEYLANVPDIIQERIVTIKEYISSPLDHLKTLILDDDGDNSNKSMNIIEALEDLEYHLMDIDMARDFHIMGGWPLLVSLLTDDIHSFHSAMEEIIRSENVTTTSTNDNEPMLTIELSKEKQHYLDQIQQMIWKVQSLASWSIGTAVKNIDEFHPWALEDMSSLLQQTEQQQTEQQQQQQQQSSTDSTLSSSSSNVNVISILLSKLETIDSKNTNINYLSPQWFKLKQKELYALGSLLRGNKYATYYFDVMDGPSIVGNFFHTLVMKSKNGNDDDGVVVNNANGVKMLSKVMMLGVDLLKDASVSSDDVVVSSPEEGEEETSINANLNHAIISKLSNNTWCNMPWVLLQQRKSSNQLSTMVQSQIIEAMVELSLHCDYSSYTNNDVERYVNDPESRGMIDSIQLG